MGMTDVDYEYFVKRQLKESQINNGYGSYTLTRYTLAGKPSTPDRADKLEGWWATFPAGEDPANPVWHGPVTSDFRRGEKVDKLHNVIHNEVWFKLLDRRFEALLKRFESLGDDNAPSVAKLHQMFRDFRAPRELYQQVLPAEEASVLKSVSAELDHLESLIP